MKKASAILLLFVFTFNLVDFLLVFKVQQYQVRKQIKQLIKQGVPDDELVQISITSENHMQLDWKHEKEFRYKGTMYDIVKTEIIDDTTTIYHCVTDKQETALFANLDEQVRKNMDTKNNGNNPLKNSFKLLSNIYFQPQTHAWILPQINAVIKCEFSHFYSSPALDITGPPPK
ncbi:MAG TPA: hypothetical protein VLB84_00420 [Bacteroidia bacterium]|nr:hypothetical protein [Bacteroidia bacterium]